jgi:hypothetical protein
LAKFVGKTIGDFAPPPLGSFTRLISEHLVTLGEATQKEMILSV